MKISTIENNEIREKKNCARGRQVSYLEGFIQTIGINIGGVFIPNFILVAFLINEMHASHVLIGFLNSLQFIVGFLQPISNIVVHKLKHRRTLVALSSYGGRALFAGAIFLGMFVHNSSTQVLFVGILIIAAISMSFSSSAWSTWMADIVPENIRGRYFSIRNSICGAAGILAVLMGGLLLKYFPGKTGFISIYSIAFITATIGTVLLLIQYEPEAKEKIEGSLLDNYKNIFKDKNFLSFVWMVVFSNFSLNIAGPFYNVHYLDFFKMPYDTLAILAAIAAVTSILGFVFFGKLSDIIGNRVLLRLCLMLLMAPPAIMIFAPAHGFLPFVTVTILLQAFILSGWNLCIFNTSLSISPRAQRSLYLGVFTAMNATSAIISPILGGFLIDHFKEKPLHVFGLTPYPTLIVFAISAVLLLIGLIIYPYFREKEEAQEYSMRDIILRFDFPNVLYRLFLSSFIPHIPSRTRLAMHIGETKSPVAVIPLEKLLYDMDYEVRRSAIEGLEKIGSNEALETLIEYYEDANLLEKKEIIRALRSYNHPEAIKILVKCLDEKETLLKAEAIHSLSYIIDPDIRLLALKRFEDEKDPDLFILYLELLAQYHQLDILPLTLKRYARIRNYKRKNYILYCLSILFDVRKEFYHFMSYETADEQEAHLEEYYRKIFDSIRKDPVLRRNKKKMKDIDRIYQELYTILTNNKITSLKPFKKQMVELLSRVMITTHPQIMEFIDFFFNKATIHHSEIALLFLEISRYLSIKNQMKEQS